MQAPLTELNVVDIEKVQFNQLKSVLCQSNMSSRGHIINLTTSVSQLLGTNYATVYLHMFSNLQSIHIIVKNIVPLVGRQDLLVTLLTTALSRNSLTYLLTCSKSKKKVKQRTCIVPCMVYKPI